MTSRNTKPDSMIWHLIKAYKSDKCKAHIPSPYISKFGIYILVVLSIIAFIVSFILSDKISHIWPEGLRFIAGVVIMSLICGGCVTPLIIDGWLFRIKTAEYKWNNDKKNFDRKEEAREIGKIFPRPSILLTGMLGAFERVSYTIAIYTGVLEFIPIWLAFKVVTRWTHKESGESGKPIEYRKSSENRPSLTVLLGNIYLIGNLLTLSFGTIGALVWKEGFDLYAWAKYFSCMLGR